MDQVLGLKCTLCSAEYAPDEVEYVCPQHGNEGILDVVYDYHRIADRLSPKALAECHDRSIWRYLPLLPVDADLARRLAADTTLASVGWTPLLPAPRGARGSALEADCTERMVESCLRLLPLYRFSAWSEESDFLFG